MAEIVRKVCERHGIRRYTVKNLAGNEKGEGYLGELNFVTVTDEETKRTLDLVIKKNFTNGPFSLRPQFLNEILMYTEIWPALNQVQAKVEDKFESVTDLLDCCDKEKEEMIILRNLKNDGFEIYDKKIPLDRKHASKILTELGKFHALSYALKKINNEEYVKLSKQVENLYYNYLGDFSETWVLSLEVAFKALDSVEDEVLVKYLKNFLTVAEVDKMMKKSIEYNEGNDVILHGDPWTSNALYKYNDERDLTEMKLLDFQLIFVGSPIQDVAFALYSGASEEIIDDIERYLKIYHDSLADHYRKIVGEKLYYTFDAFKEEFVKYNKMSFLLATIVWKMKATKPEHVIEMSEIENPEDVSLFTKTPYDEEFFNKNIRPIIKHIHKLDTIGW